MKILQVSPKFCRYAASGSTKVVYDLSHELAKRGHLVTIYSSDMKDKYQRADCGIENEHNMRIHRFRAIGTIFTREMKFFITPYIIATLNEEIKHFDIIHLHEYQSFQNIVTYYFAKRHRIPYILQAHGSMPRNEKKFRKWLYDLIIGRKIILNASEVIALSKLEANSYEKAGVQKNRIAIIPNGIEFSNYEDFPKGSFKKMLSLPDDAQVILYLGRIHQSKGLEQLIRAFEIVSRRFEKAKLVIIGPDDGYLASVSNLVSELRLKDKVVFTGFVNQRTKMTAFKDSTVFVTPHFSGFPLVFLEACLMGCPIVTASTELKWIDNVGFIVEDSFDAIAQAIMKILQDEKTYERFHNNCVKTAISFDISETALRFEGIYCSILNNSMKNIDI